MCGYRGNESVPRRWIQVLVSRILLVSTGSVLICAANLDDKTPTRRRRRQKPSLKEYLTSDSFWMNESVKRIDEMLKWNMEEMKSVEHKKTKLISFRQYVLDCGAEERKYTTKWEQ